jgi:hypothetical protein
MSLVRDLTGRGRTSITERYCGVSMADVKGLISFTEQLNAGIGF